MIFECVVADVRKIFTKIIYVHRSEKRWQCFFYTRFWGIFSVRKWTLFHKFCIVWLWIHSFVNVEKALTTLARYCNLFIFFSRRWRKEKDYRHFLFALIHNWCGFGRIKNANALWQSFIKYVWNEQAINQSMDVR